MTRDDVEHLLAVLLAAAGAQRVPEHHFRLGVVHPFAENEPAARARIVERPTGEGARDGDDVLLRVAAVHAQRVQLEQLAAVVLVQPVAAMVHRTAARPLRLAELGQRHVARVRGALEIVEVLEHRGTVRDRAEQVAEFPEHARTNDVAIVLEQREARGHLAREHREMVLPEVREHFDELRARSAVRARPSRPGTGCSAGCARSFIVLNAALSSGVSWNCAFGARPRGDTQIPDVDVLRRERIGEDGQRASSRPEAPAARRRAPPSLMHAGAELAVDPAIGAHGDHAIDVAGTRAEREAADRLCRLLVGGEFAHAVDRRGGWSCRGRR